MARRSALSLSFDTLRLEGALLLPDILEKAAHGELSDQTTAQYQVPKGLTLQDEYGRAFQIAQAQWKLFAPNMEREDTDASKLTHQFVRELLQDVLAYSDLTDCSSLIIGERSYPIDFITSGHVPIVIAPHYLALDEAHERFAIEGSGSRKKSAFQLAQEFLNASEECRWGIASNGRQLRLLRDAAALTRPSFLEFDLQGILDDVHYSDFIACWRILHSSRAKSSGAEDNNCIWENWRNQGQREGTRVREGLRDGVTEALLTLGEGFLQPADNEDLRACLYKGDLSSQAYFQQLLRLIYRLIFLFTIEERGLLHPRKPNTSPERLVAGRIYTEGYALSRLRDRCLRRTAFDHHDDIWQSVRIVFKGLAKGEKLLDLPALGGLFAESQCLDLDQASLSNRALLTVIRHLRWSRRSGALAPVDYRNMGSEEIGSVYESLLELVPEIDIPARRFDFAGLTSDASTQGNIRKTTGSYYTPDSLVQELIKSALDPVIDQRLAESPHNPSEALLSIRVIDPACGSGHFLLAAARRLAERLAALQASDGVVRPEDYRHALHKVISHCIYGVDKNPMALELTRTALWLEGYEEGKALSFLDHHLQCGDALIGVTDLKQLTYGIPRVAFKPLSGDDKNLCSVLAKENSEFVKAFEKRKNDPNQQLDLKDAVTLKELQQLEALPDTTIAQVDVKETLYETVQQQFDTNRLKQAADLFAAAFLMSKPENAEIDQIPNSQNLYLALYEEQSAEQLANIKQQDKILAATELCREKNILHWSVTFAHIFAEGGFDCVLGNPPWERIKLQEEEFFATRNPLVAEAKNKAERSQRIQWLSEGMLARHLYPELEHPEGEDAEEKHLHLEFIDARRTAEAASVFAHLKKEEGGRYPLTGVGDVNTYALFAETISQIASPNGRAGFIVPTGIATDDSTKAYFAHIVQTRQLASLYDFENREAIFAGVHRSYKFCLMTLGHSESAEFAFFLTQTPQLTDERRRFTLSADDFVRINPNTLTCPIFRSNFDAELTKKIYQRVPVLIREARDGKPEENPWGILFMRMFDMSNDSHLFHNAGGGDRLPLYEAKMIHQFDHRWATYKVENGKDVSKTVPLENKQDPSYSVEPRYWVDKREVYLRTARLPRALLKAIADNDQELISLGLAHLLFAHWLIREYTTAEKTLANLYPAWCDFVEHFPFARDIAPTRLGLCGDNPESLKPLGSHYLPAEPIDKIQHSAREKTLWYAADDSAIGAYSSFAVDYKLDLSILLEETVGNDIFSIVEKLLEQTVPKWLMGWRDICRATDQRTLISNTIPLFAVGDKYLLIIPSSVSTLCATLLGCLNSLVCDFVARQKIGGTSLKYFTMKQIAILSPNKYTETDISFVVPRVLKLTYTSHDLKPWSNDLGYDTDPFVFDPNCRAVLRAELDAYYAKLYGLNRNELRYILDPADVMGSDYPSETFRVLKNNEEKEFGEYRTRRLVLEAWDKLERGELH